jgi:hypothetical protein
MNEANFKALKPGDLVRHKSHHQAAMVHTHHGDHVTVVKILDLSNPGEWHRVHPNGTIMRDDEP